MRILWKKAVKSPQRQEPRPQTPAGLWRTGTPPPDFRVVPLTY